MLEEILDRRNIEKALVQVERNKGAGGVDGLSTEDLRVFLNANWKTLRASILQGNYVPSAVRKVEIPKPNGGKRMLGIPTVIDRMLQQAIAQWMQPKYDPLFSERSFGFRPGRNAHQAVLQAQRYLAEGGTSFGVDTIYYIVSNLCGTDTTSHILTVVGCPDEVHLHASQGNVIIIYPNPSTNSLTITSTSDKITTVAVCNLLGQTLYTHEHNTEKVQVDVADLPSGVYLIRINGSEVRKFVKQ